MSFKSFMFLFLIGVLVSCSSNRDKPVKSEERIIFPDNGKGCCE